MSKKDEKKPTEGKETQTGDENPKDNDRRLFVEHIHRIVTGTDDDKGEGNKPPENPEKPPASGEGDDDTKKKDGETGTAQTSQDVQGDIDETAKALKKVEDDKKALEEKIGKLSKRLKGYEKKEENEKVEDIKSHIEDLRKSAEEKDVIAGKLKKIEEELTKTKGKLEERETELGEIAMKAFNEEKTELIEAVKKDLGEDKAKEVAEKIKTPDQLEEVKGWLAVFVKAFGEKKEGDKKGGDEGDDDDESGGEDLSSTGGQVPLKVPSRKQAFERGRDVINALYDAYETELFKKETGKQFDVAKFADLEGKVRKLWGSVLEGIAKRGGKVLGEAGSFDVRTCQYCHRVFMGDQASCPYCKKSVQPWERGKSSIRRR